SLFWDGRVATLEEQALVPIDNPAEMDMRPAALAGKLNDIASYRRQFQKVFGGKATPARIARALAAYERYLVSDTTPFERSCRAERGALTSQAPRAMRLFFNQAPCTD